MILDFNSDWIFIKENGERTNLTLPHDAMLSEKRRAECRSGKQGAYFPGGKYQYIKEFIIEKDTIGKTLKLLFEGVYRNATITLNDKELLTHKYGYTEFEVDISKAVLVGKNIIKVSVDNSLVPNCRWYSGSGIYRPVSLLVDHPNESKIRTISYSPAIIEIDVEEGAEVEIYDKDKLIAKGTSGKYEIPSAKLWSSENPYLYTCITRVNGEEEKTDFGIRKIEWSGETGLLINGKEVLLRGGCIHHDNGVLGAACFKDAEERRVRLLKEAGFNALRIAHNPASRYLLDACDKYGMYVMDETFDGWYIPKDFHDYSRDFFEGYENDLKSMVDKDYNHPSVIMYSIGNEVTETASKKGIILANNMRNYIKAIDDTRPVTCGINVLLDVYVQLGMGVYKDKGDYIREPLPEIKGYKEKKTGSSFFNAMTNKLGRLMFFMSKGKRAEKIVKDISYSLDIVGLNYASSRYDKDAKKYPDRLMVGAETMVADLPYNWERVKKYKQLIGDFVWSAWDYLGEACIGDWTYHSYKGLPLLAGQGMIDITGFAKAQMYFMQIVWGLRKEPFLCVSPLNHSSEIPSKGAWQFTDAIDSWNWKGYEGKNTKAEVYVNAPLVRLELNGKKIAIKKVKDFRAEFNIKYESGTLSAIALDLNGRELSKTYLKTGKDTILTVRQDKKTLRANSQDLCFLEIEFTDDKGNLIPLIEQRVNIFITGENAILQGFGSALCKTDEVFDKNYHDSYRGRALAVFRATDKKGRTKIQISSKGVKPVEVEIEVI